jgi:hypothetical protein
VASINDLDVCSYLPLECDALLAVGWLGRDTKFVTGSVSDQFIQKLKELCSNPWEPVASIGFHSCELCQYDAPRFSSNVFIPFQGNIFVAPVAIIHYITTHWYLPPAVFYEAVIACLSMNSLEYKKAILTNGGRNLINSKKT